MVEGEVCSRQGKPCSLHPDLCPATKGNRASMCRARDTIKARFQEAFKSLLGLRCFYPEPQKGGNSNTGNLSSNVFKNSKVSAEILGIPEELLDLLWDLLVSVNSSQFQDITTFKSKARRVFDIWVKVFTRRPMTANLHLLLSHAADYIRWYLVFKVVQKCLICQLVSRWPWNTPWAAYRRIYRGLQ